MKAALQAIFCLALIGLVFFVIWPRNVEIRIPKDFRGFIRVTENPSSRQPKIGVFKLIVQVSSSGEATVRSLDIFRRFHHQTASFNDGSPLPACFAGTRSTGVALQIMGLPHTEQVFFYVGTEKEVTAYLMENALRLYATPDKN